MDAVKLFFIDVEILELKVTIASMGPRARLRITKAIRDSIIVNPF